MNCSKCLDRCKAYCCGSIPIEVERFQRNIEKIVNPVIKVEVFNGAAIPDDITLDMSKMAEVAVNKPHAFPYTKDGNCCFLNEDLSCNIYEDRPPICKKFGDESHENMTCKFQKKDGSMRTRQERRMLERQQSNALTGFITKVGKDG